MKKLYLASQIGDTMFVSPKTDPSQLVTEARGYFRDEGRTMMDSQVLITEVHSAEQIPEDWRKGQLLIWGADETTPDQWLSRYTNPEYQEYLRLKAIFE